MTIQQIISTAYPAKASATKAFNKINEELWLCDGGDHEPSANELKVICQNKRIAAVVAAM